MMLETFLINLEKYHFRTKTYENIDKITTMMIITQLVVH